MANYFTACTITYGYGETEEITPEMLAPMNENDIVTHAMANCHGEPFWIDLHMDFMGLDRQHSYDSRLQEWTTYIPNKGA